MSRFTDLAASCHNLVTDALVPYSRKGQNQDLPKSYFTGTAVLAILQSVGRCEAETGGVLIGPRGKDGISQFHFDLNAASSRATYSPSYREMEELCERAATEGYELKGFCHSHPGLETPSGPDIDYAALFFAANPGMQRFYMPILPHVPIQSHITKETAKWLLGEIRCYVIDRARPHIYQETKITLTSEERFPTMATSSPMLPDVAACLKDMSTTWRQVMIDGLQLNCLQCEADDREIAVFIPTEFPALGPSVVIFYSDGSSEEFPVHWRMESARPAAARLVRLIEAARRYQPSAH